MSNVLQFDGETAGRRLAASTRSHLTPRQRQVLLLLCEGLSNKMIGRRVGVSEATIKTHIASLLRSLGVANRIEAVGVAYKLGIAVPMSSDEVLSQKTRPRTVQGPGGATLVA